jgi:hypothetical protein
MEERKEGTACWITNGIYKPGAIIQLLMTYEDVGNARATGASLRALLPSNVDVVPTSTRLFNGNYPMGYTYQSNGIADGGVEIGNYNVGINAYVEFEVGLPFEQQLSCGVNNLKMTAVAQVDQITGQAFEASSLVQLVRQCDGPSPTPNY